MTMGALPASTISEKLLDGISPDVHNVVEDADELIKF